jgi:putative DNA primase/helicase
MTEHSQQLTGVTAEEASRIIAADIKAWPKDGPNKREEHLRLFSGLLSREVIEAAWAQRYAEIARAQGRRWPPPRPSSFLPAPQPTADEKPKATALSVPADERKADGAVEVLDPSNPLSVAQRFIAVRGQYNGTRIIHRWRGKFWNWRDNHYRPTDDDAIRAALYSFLSAADIEVRFGKCSAYTALKPNKTMVNNIFDALEAVALVDQEYEMPSWFGAPKVFGVNEVNSNELVAMKNGLLYLPTRKLVPHSPDFFSANVLDFGYDPNAQCPRFRQFLRELWPRDFETQRLVLEMFGLCLTDVTRCQKAFMFVGPKRGGRGTMGRVLRGLAGPENFVGATLKQFSGQFGMQSWIGKKIAVFTDASLDGISKREHGIIAENLKRITGEDAIPIPQKYHRDWEGILHTRVIVFSNEMLHFQDASGALPARFIAIIMRESFEDRPDKMLTDKLLAERPGIFNLALDALDNLCARGWEFIQPKTGEGMLEELKDLAAVVRVFAKDRCELGAFEILEGKLYLSYRAWCELHGHHPTSEETFSTKLRAQFPSVDSHRPRNIDGVENRGRRTVLTGIRLRGS